MTAIMNVDYEFIKKWMSEKELRDIREGDNPHGIVVSRQQMWNIIKGSSKNFRLRNYVVERAIYNESLNNTKPQ